MRRFFFLDYGFCRGGVHRLFWISFPHLARALLLGKCILPYASLARVSHVYEWKRSTITYRNTLYVVCSGISRTKVVHTKVYLVFSML
uniref:Putative secreted protein n=1 Tax=Anopheles darlingi TaxID=43151 RepID=A0A2M4D975_ANODA